MSSLCAQAPGNPIPSPLAPAGAQCEETSGERGQRGFRPQSGRGKDTAGGADGVLPSPVQSWNSSRQTLPSPDPQASPHTPSLNSGAEGSGWEQHSGKGAPRLDPGPRLPPWGMGAHLGPPGHWHLGTSQDLLPAGTWCLGILPQARAGPESFWGAPFLSPEPGGEGQGGALPRNLSPAGSESWGAWGQLLPRNSPQPSLITQGQQQLEETFDPATAGLPSPSLSVSAHTPSSPPGCHRAARVGWGL